MSTNERLDALEANLAIIADALGMPDKLRQRPNGRAVQPPIETALVRDLQRHIDRTRKMVFGITRAADTAMSELVILSDMLDQLSPRPIPTTEARRPRAKRS